MKTTKSSNTSTAPIEAAPTTPVYPTRTTLKALSKRFQALSVPVKIDGANFQIFFTDQYGVRELTDQSLVNNLSTEQWIEKAKAWASKRTQPTK